MSRHCAQYRRYNIRQNRLYLLLELAYVIISQRKPSGGSDGKESACNAGDQGLTLGQEEPLEKGMATHSSILVWRIPWAEEPSGLQSMALQRVGHD